MTDFCVNCGKRDCDMICPECNERTLTIYEQKLIAEFLAEYDNFIEVIQGIEFQCGFQGIPFTDKLKNKIKEIKGKREKWEQK